MTKIRLIQGALLISLAPVLACASWGQTKNGVIEVLDDFHVAASEADSARYFAHFAEQAIFFGTDIAERWSLEEFQAYAGPYFRAGRGWTYVPQQRAVFLNGDTAWFDETLKNENFGLTRGTGVLTWDGSHWKLTQYHLTLPVPNDLINQLVDLINAMEE